jgi:KDO2-lipid IV(A) lauroyltransferase
MFEYILYRIAQALALAIPRKKAYLIAQFISDVRYLFAYQDRRAITENLRAIFPDKTTSEIRKIRRRVFRNFAKYLVDFLRFRTVDKSYLDKNVTIENLHYIDNALKEGKGVIVITAHLGNWELGGAILAILGYNIWGVALTHSSKQVDTFFNTQRTSKGMRVIPLGKAVRKCLQALSLNHILALVGDRDFSKNGSCIQFFGKPTLFPEGPARLALATGALVIPGFTIKKDDDTFCLHFESPLEITPQHNNSVASIISEYKSIYERFIKAYPDQWYMFRKFWMESKS